MSISPDPSRADPNALPNGQVETVDTLMGRLNAEHQMAMTMMNSGQRCEHGRPAVVLRVPAPSGRLVLEFGCGADCPPDGPGDIFIAK